MSGILFLGNEDFCVRAGEKGNMLCLSGWKGLTLVMFYSKECQFCHKLINKFKQLPTIVNGCKFGMVCVNRNMEIVEKSKNTIAPIEYVPDVILYVDGVPYIRYDGPHEIDDIKSFIFNVYERLQKTCFSENNAPPAAAAAAPPAGSSHEQMRMMSQQSKYPQQQQDHTTQQAQQHMIRNVQNSIPQYTVGVPVSGKKTDQGRCYLDFKTAYPNKNGPPAIGVRN